MLVIFLGYLRSKTQVTETTKLCDANMDQNVKSRDPVVTIRLSEVKLALFSYNLWLQPTTTATPKKISINKRFNEKDNVYERVF